MPPRLIKRSKKSKGPVAGAAILLPNPKPTPAQRLLKVCEEIRLNLRFPKYKRFNSKPFMVELHKELPGKAIEVHADMKAIWVHLRFYAGAGRKITRKFPRRSKAQTLINYITQRIQGSR